MEKMKRATAIFYIFLLLCVVCTSIGADEYKISVDDVLNITVYREDDLSLIVRVGTDGCIPYPLLGNIKAAGLTVPELEKVLTEGLKKYIQTPHVSIFISEYSTVTVNGEVLKPGMYPLKPGLTVLEAISLAGGFTDFAARNSIKIMRHEDKEDKTIIVEAGRISESGNKSQDVPLKPGDIVVVEYNTITVSGEVMKPDMYPLKPGLTVLEAISLAGGFTDFAARNSVKIIRSENGTDKNIVVQAENISKKGNKSKDVQLKDRDIIFVPESLF